MCDGEIVDRREVKDAGGFGARLCERGGRQTEIGLGDVACEDLKLIKACAGLRTDAREVGFGACAKSWLHEQEEAHFGRGQLCDQPAGDETGKACEKDRLSHSRQ